ncbi:hypothetical protein MCEZE9_00451 [Candidatus Nanopelagicaceae bacterium]|jgi:hypothetical protein
MSRAASAFALVISLLSTGAVIAHNCHNEAQAPVVTMEHEHSTHSEAGSAGSNLLNEICFGIIFFALLFGGKYLLLRRRARNLDRLLGFWNQSLNYLRPPNLTFALSLPQLGISRI